MIKAQHQSLFTNRLITSLKKKSEEILVKYSVDINQRELIVEETKKAIRKQLLEKEITHYENARVFYIEEDFSYMKPVKQNFSITLKLPFKNLLINYKNPSILNGYGYNKKLIIYAISLCQDESQYPILGFNYLDKKYLNLVNQNPHYKCVFFFDMDMESGIELILSPNSLPAFQIPFCKDYLNCDYHKSIYSQMKAHVQSPTEENTAAPCIFIPHYLEKKLCPAVRTGKLLINFIINQINFLNSSNVKFVPAGISTKSNRERERQGLPTLPPPYYCCKVELPKTIREGTTPISGEHKRFKFKFDVRGHFRHLMSEYYKNKQGQMIWIPPHQRGEGVYIPKTYHFIDKEEELEAGGSVGP